MNSDDFENAMNPIPTWDELISKKQEELVEIKNDVLLKLQFDYAASLYNSWREIATLLFAFSGQEYRDDLPIQIRNYIDDIMDNMQESIVTIPSKIYSAAFSNVYFIQMDNASFIRSQAIYVSNAIGSIAMFNPNSESQVQMLQEMIAEFKGHFITWIHSFRKDDLQDEWGLFN